MFRRPRQLILTGFVTVLLGQVIYLLGFWTPGFSSDLGATVELSVAPIASALFAWAWWSWLGSLGVHRSSRRPLTIFAVSYAVLAAGQAALAVQLYSFGTGREYSVAFSVTFVGSSLIAAGFWMAARTFRRHDDAIEGVAPADWR